MARPTSMSTGGGLVRLRYGVEFSLVPSTQGLGSLELQRATAANAPSSKWVQLYIFPPGRRTNVSYIDYGPNTIVARRYRFRENFVPGYQPSALSTDLQCL